MPFTNTSRIEEGYLTLQVQSPSLSSAVSTSLPRHTARCDLESNIHTDLFDLPKHHKCVAFAELGKKHGPLTFLKAISKPLLILNTFEAAQDLLDKRGHIYSDRPHLHFAGDIVGTYVLIPQT